MNINIKSINETIDINISQVRTLCECLFDFKNNIKKMPDDIDVYHKQRRIIKEKQVDELFEILQKYANYNGGSFETALNICLNKKENKLDIGSDPITLISK
ncbi:hypothetical protein FDB61_15820 [Clostridium botulinum]|nr:hypothetical protein [Clostridium botulinum]